MTNISDIAGDAAYRTIEEYGQGEYEDRKSRFIGEVKHVEHEADAIAFIDAVKAKYPDARHHVYAYVLRENNRVRYSDDGEPKRTAGLPVLDVIEHLDVRDVVCVVSRYFGGTLLGTGGLVRAYTKSAQLAFEDARIVALAPCNDMVVSIDYAGYDQLVHFLAGQPAAVLDTSFGADVTVTVRVREEDAAQLEAGIVELTNGRAELLIDEARLQLVDA